MPITVKDILTRIPGRFDAEAAGDWEATIQFEFSSDGSDEENWTVNIKNGECTVSEGEIDDPSATVKTAAETWIGMTTGDLNPVQAFMSGKLRVSGDMGAVMKLNDPKIFRREKKTEE